MSPGGIVDKDNEKIEGQEPEITKEEATDQESADQGSDKNDETSTEENVSPEVFRLRKSLDGANKEAAGYRTKLREVEAKLAEAVSKEDYEALKADLAKANRAALLREIGDEVGLPGKLALRLSGETPEELKADAQELLKLIKDEGSDVDVDKDLKGGLNPNDEDDTDGLNPRELAKKARRGR